MISRLAISPYHTTLSHSPTGPLSVHRHQHARLHCPPASLDLALTPGDLSHLASIFILLHKIQTSRSCRGISFKSQALYLLVFVTRYLDLFTNYVSLYNSLMKLIFISTSAYVLYLMKFRFRPTQDPALDTFNVAYVLGPCALLALVFNYAYTFMEVTWSFSIWTESVAILPQLFMLQRTGEAETITTHYLAALGLYRALYIPNWLYR